MSITEELREYAGNFYLFRYKDVREKLDAIADRIDAEHESAMAESWDNGYESDYLGIEQWLTEHPQVMEHHGWVQLPKDADGEPWRLGDELMMEGEVCEVVGIGDGIVLYAFEDGVEWTRAAYNRHYRRQDVEYVLRDFTDAILEWAGKSGTVAETGTWSDVAAKYVKRLRIAEDDCD